MAATARKLMVEVVEARDLLPKDGTGTSSPYVVIDFDGQRRRTQTVRRDLNPTWNEVLEFNVTGSLDIAGEPLEVDVLHDRRVGPSRRNNFLGRVRIDARQFVRKGEEALIYFPLEKKSFFNWVRGEIGLRIYYVDEPIVEPEAPPPPPAETPPPAAAAGSEAEVKPEAQPKEESEAKPAEETAAAPAAAEDTSTTDQPPMPPAADGGEAPEAAAAAPEPPPVAEQAPEPPPTESDTPAEPSAEAPTTESKPQETPPPVQEAEKEMTPRWVPQPMPPPAALEPAVIEKSSYDLVDKMHYLFVRVVRARSLPGDAKPHVRVEALGRNVSTATARRGAFFEWDQTITFPRHGPTSSSAAADPSTLEVSVWDLPPGSDVTTADAADKHFLGGVCFDVSEVPTRDLPDSQLAPQWYRLEGAGRGSRRSGDLMLATWIGTQADESFSDSLKADVDSGDNHVTSRSKVYLSPKLWYLRATVIEANDTLTSSRESGVYVKAALGFQALKTRPTATRNGTPSWNEDLIFVAAEPFGDDKLVFSLELRHGKDVAAVGSASVDLSSVERRVDDRRVASRWLDLQPGEEFKKPSKKQRTCVGGRLHVRVCLDGGYHVADEPPHSASDFRPSARQLWGPQVGTIELGLIGCKSLLPMKAIDGKGVTDAYAVAKYGPKWARTRTVPNSFDPAWNEQYTWPVYDPCTVLTVGVFDESDASKDSTSHPMGKIRIRISTLESNRSLRCSYPLTVLLPSGPKKMGEVEIAVRFSRFITSLDLIHVYGRPMLPPMHHVRPISSLQRDPLRLAAARIVAAHLSRSEPSLKREVVVWMLDSVDPRGFSMRKVRSNYNRILSSLSWIADVARWAEDTRAWRNPTATMIAHGVMILLIWFPELIVPTLAIHVFGTGLWRYRYRVRIPLADPSVKISGADVAEREELDEEFDPIPSTRGDQVVRVRYDRVRAMGARVQGMLGDVAAQTERMHALMTWRDPRATGVFLGACLVVAMIMYLVPSRLVALVAGLYFLRHPVFRDRMPSPALNFFRRLPSLSDRIL